MTKIFELKRNDRQPAYPAKVQKSDGSAQNIEGATIRVVMVNLSTGEKKINRLADGVSITNGPGGEFEFAWQDGDTDTAGNYEIEFEIIPQSGGKFTVPRGREKAYVLIEADGDAA